MFVVCFVYYLLLVLLVLSARDVGPGWMPPPGWGVYGMPMSEAWVAFLPLVPHTPGPASCFSPMLMVVCFMVICLLSVISNSVIMVVPRWSPIPRTPNE